MWPKSVKSNEKTELVAGLIFILFLKKTNSAQLIVQIVLKT